MSEADDAKENVTVEEVANENLQEKIKTLQEENADLQDKYLRKHADFENYRKRMTKEKADAIIYANADLMKNLLNILDNFERAIKASSETNDFESLKQGIVMVDSEMSSVLKSHGLEKIDTLNTEFNPEVHNAINMVEDEEGKITVPTVVSEYQSGYKLNDRILRSAMVQVANPKKS